VHTSGEIEATIETLGSELNGGLLPAGYIHCGSPQADHRSGCPLPRARDLCIPTLRRRWGLAFLRFQLFKDSSWFDILVIYSNNHRNIITMEKGTLGERLFNAAFTAWERSKSSP
jgi:hypothetical protein